MYRPIIVTAVEATQVRLVLFIFIRFKGYLDGIFSPKKGTDILEFYRIGKYQDCWCRDEIC